VLALDAQAALLPYALAAFAVGAPLVGFAALEATNAAWLTACLVQAALNWALFYAAVSWMRKSSGRRFELRPRTALHLAGGLSWALAMAELAAVAQYAGPAREALLLLSLCGAVTCFFFTAPHLLSLLIVGPLAAAPSLLLLASRPEAESVLNLAQGGAALAFALALLVNRLLRHSFAMAVEREALTEDRARALRRAEALAADKSDLLSTLSQEVRSGLSGVVHVLAAASGPATRARPSRDQLSAALDAAQDLVAMVDATLDSEGAEAGRLTVAREAVDPGELAREVVRAHEPLAASKGLVLTVECLVETGAVTADPARARQVLANLVGNAVKYTGRGGVAVRVAATGGGQVRFEVVDTGPGLAPEELAIAFQPFRRVERTGAGVPGAGLGLSLSRQLAQLMGGEVSAESAPGVGSRFWLDLPFDAGAERTGAKAAATPGGRPLRVLTVEGDTLCAAMLRASLDQLGHRMLHAHDGSRALELLRSCDVDAVLVGALSVGEESGLSGPEMVRAIRALPSPAARARVVAVVGTEIEAAGRCMQAGADAVLRKPITVGAVARALAGATEPASRTRAA
jgi:signal transduction histidine kinase/ActR/RegA family two-component response regulator